MLFRKSVWADVGGFDEQIVATCDYRFLQQVAQKYDLGYVPYRLCEWHLSSGTLSLSSPRARTDRDMFRVYSQFRHELLTAAGVRAVRQCCKDLTLGLAYHHRQEREFRESAAKYLQCLRYGGIAREAVFGLMKLPLFWLLRQTKRAASKMAA